MGLSGVGTPQGAPLRPGRPLGATLHSFPLSRPFSGNKKPLSLSKVLLPRQADPGHCDPEGVDMSALTNPSLTG